MKPQYQSTSDIQEVIEAFENCTAPKDQFPHISHLTVAVWYVHAFGFEQATIKMREGLQRFLMHHGIAEGKYNETTTLFWLRLIDKKLGHDNEGESLLELTNRIVDDLSHARLIFEYYSFERLNSPEAKQNWVEPDLKTLD